jgi:hypothetical protein
MTLEEARFLIAAKEAVAPTAAANTLAPAVTPATPAPGAAVSTTDGTWTGANLVTAYEWQASFDAGTTWRKVTSGTGNGTNSFTPDAATYPATTRLRCVVIKTNGAGAVRATSNTVTVT